MKKYEILLVDDDDLLLSAVGEELESEGYGVTTAQSGEEALAILDKRSFDVVLTDLVMGLIDGILVLKKSKELHPETMVIIFTGHGSIDSAIKAVQHKADDYLLKPCKNSELIFRVARCIATIEKNKRISFYEDILPVCVYCKNIRNDASTEPGNGKWLTMEEYLHGRIGVDISHTVCPQCQGQAEKDMLGD